MHDDSILDELNRRLAGYRDFGAARRWLESHRARVETLFGDEQIRDFVFEPVRGVLAPADETTDAQVRAVISQVALANAVMAGLPGKMGVGVAVSMALEGWMAWTIARHVGAPVRSIDDVWRYLAGLAGVVVTIGWGFRALLGLGFSMFSVLPGVNPLIPAEIFVTNLVGVLFWTGFRALRERGRFTVPARLMKGVFEETVALYRYQARVLAKGLSPDNLRLMYDRLSAWLSGEIAVDRPRLRGELFTTAAMAYLLAGRHEALQGPLGQEFLQAIRDRIPSLADAPIERIADYLAAQDADQLAGTMNLIKGKLFERLIAHAENTDGDAWHAVLHADESFPGSDIILENSDTGDILELSLKATDNPAYIEHALARYPDIPILATSEVAEQLRDHAPVLASEWSNAELEAVTRENFDALLDDVDRLQVAGAAARGLGAATLVALWPFTVAWLRGRISRDQLEAACQRVLGDAGRKLASRLAWAAVLGPVFAWWMLARGVVRLVPGEPRPAAAHHVRLVVPAPAPAGG